MAGDVDNNGYNDFFISVININSPIVGRAYLYLSKGPYENPSSSTTSKSSATSPIDLIGPFLALIIILKFRKKNRN